MSRPRSYDRPRGRFNKQVRVRRKRYGLWWEGYGVAHKVISLAKQTEDGIEIGDTISKFMEGEKKVVTVVVKGVYTYGRPPQKVYTFDLHGKEMITPARGWKKTVIQEFPLKLVLKSQPDIRWKGKWRTPESSIKFTIPPFPRADPSFIGMRRLFR